MDRRLVFETISGSRAYDTFTEDSDYDYRAVAFPSIKEFYGLGSFEVLEQKNPDKVIYSLKKFIGLALQNNPNILEMLFIDDPSLIRFESTTWRAFKSIRKSFLSKKIYKSYIGYATDQLRKVIANNGTDFSRTGKSEKRIANIEKHGYDTKAALHLYRLISQAEEIEMYRHIYIPLSPLVKTICCEIRDGKWTFEQFIRTAQINLEALRIMEKVSTLPDKPDYEKIEDVLINVAREYYENNR